MVKHIIVTIHGIQTNLNKSKWQEEMSDYLLTRSDEVRVRNYKYPFVSNFLGILPWVSTLPTQQAISKTLRNYYAGRLKAFIRKQRKQHPKAQIHIVAHSFGTWIAHEVMKELPLKVSTVHLVAGVVSAFIQYNKLDEELNKGEIRKIYVYSSKKDEITKFAPPPFGPPGFANCGFWGIIKNNVEQMIRPVRKPYDNLEIYNEITNNEHSSKSYFNKAMFNKILAYVTAEH